MKPFQHPDGRHHPPRVQSPNIKDKLYPNFLNLFDKITWTTFMTKNISIVLVNAQEPNVNYLKDEVSVKSSWVLGR